MQSSHKTLTSLSQTAMLHLGHKAFQYHAPKTSSVSPHNAHVFDANKGPHEKPSAPVHSQDSVGTAQVVDMSQVESVVHSYFSMLTTTSPNSVLLASLDATRAQFEERGAQMVQQTALAVNWLRHKLRSPGKQCGGGVILICVYFSS